MSTLIRILLTIQFFYKLLLRENFRNPFKGIRADKDRRLLILANGPSLKSTLEQIRQHPSEYEGCEYFAMNSVASSDMFEVLKPKHYVISDHMFFFDTVFMQKGKAIIGDMARKTDWDMYLYVPYRYKDKEYMSIVRANSHIKVVAYHSIPYRGLDSLRNRLFAKGLGNGEYSTVILNAEYIAVTLGFRQIELYGADHNFFDNLKVNDYNVPCYLYGHFDSDETEEKPMLWHHSPDRKYFNMELFLEEKHRVFAGHNVMASYAESMGSRILNCTKGSLIDSYPRKLD